MKAMQIPIIMITILVTGCVSTELNTRYRVVDAEWKEGFYTDFDRDSLSRLMDDSRSASLTLEYSPDGQLVQLLEGVEVGIDIPSHTDASELKKFFDSHMKKNFVVIFLHKLAQVESVDSKTKSLNDLFFGAGFQRVMIVGYHSFGWPVYSDKKIQ